MALMAYFKDQGGNEITEFSGSIWCWFGSYVDGRKGTVAQVEVRKGGKRYMLTAASFPGKQVTVKMWGPGGHSEYRKLVDGPILPLHDLPIIWVGREAPAKVAA